MNYIFIADKPESEDYCYGNVMERYPSHFIFEDNLDEERLIALWADVILKNKKLRTSEVGYSVKVLIGETLYNEEVGDVNFDYWSEYEKPSDKKLELTRLQSIKEVAESKVHALEAAQKAAEEKRKATLAELDESLKKVARKAEYEKLKVEYEKLKREFEGQ